MGTKKIYMIDREFIERKAEDGTITFGTFGDSAMTVNLADGKGVFSSAEIIHEAFRRKGWSELDFAVFNALCLLYDEKEATGFPKCQVEGIARPFPLESVEDYKKPVCEISYLELYRAVTGLSETHSVSSEELEPIVAAIKKMSCTSFTPQRGTRSSAFERELQKRGIAGISYIHIITAEQIQIVSKNRELGFVRLYLKPFLFNYVDAFVHAVKYLAK